MSINRGLPRPLFTRNLRRLPVVDIKNGTFYKQSLLREGAPLKLFPSLTFEVPPPGKTIWAVVGPGSCGKTTFLEVLQGLHHCDPPGARSYPALQHGKSKGQQQFDPLRLVKYVGFGSTGMKSADTRGAYLSARFESHREATDFSLADYLAGSVNLNPTEEERIAARVAREEYFFQFVAERLNIHKLLDLPVSNLSNGQTRRARVAKALMAKPQLLLLDEPFHGLDPMTKKSFSTMLHRLVRENDLPIVLSLQTQEEVPAWISNIIYLNTNREEVWRGPKRHAVPHDQLYLAAVSPWRHIEGTLPITQTEQPTPPLSTTEVTSGESEARPPSEDQFQRQGSIQADAQSDNVTTSAVENGNDTLFPLKSHFWWDMADRAVEVPAPDPLVEMSGVKIAYGDRTIIGDWEQEHDGTKKPGLWWKIRPGDRWGVFGPNGSGKTTLLSLICSDHPQAYSLPIKMFGRSRLPSPSEPGISIFDLQARIGQSSPEVLNFFPKHFTIRQTLESAWADTFLSKPILTYEADEAIDACLRWFKPDFLRKDTDIPLSESESLEFPSWIEGGEVKRHTQAQCKAHLEQELDWADQLRFGELPLSSQKVALFLRAIVKKPDLVILDEAFSGMDDRTRAKCMVFLAYGERFMYSTVRISQGKHFYHVHDKRRSPTTLAALDKVVVEGLEPRQALLCVAHRRQEVPPLVQQWMCLPESDSDDVLTDVEGPAETKPVTPATTGKAAQDAQTCSEHEDDAAAKIVRRRKKPARFGTVRFGIEPGQDDWLEGDWWQQIWGGRGWSPEGTYLMTEPLVQYKWQNQRRRRGYDIRQSEQTIQGAHLWMKRFKGAEIERQREEWLAGQKARAVWEREVKHRAANRLLNRRNSLTKSHGRRRKFKYNLTPTRSR